MSLKEVHVNVRSPLSCFYCWRHIPPHQLKWISESKELFEDHRLGEEQARFLPTRFTADGRAIDEMGSPCDRLACPNCHLPIPKESLRTRPFFVSVAGTPSSGKTFFLTAMIHCLRKILADKACFSFESLESGGSKLLFENEDRLFGNPESDELVSLEKTQEFGELYRLVQFNQELVSYPQPFLFHLRPTLDHPHRRQKQKISRLIALYDNAGESFDVGRDSLVNPVTRHLGLANVLMFCLDLHQETAFQNKIRKPRSGVNPRERPNAEPNNLSEWATDKPPSIHSSIPQESSMGFKTGAQRSRERTAKPLRPGHQLESFKEMCRRANQYSPTQSTRRNLIIVVTKFDEWSSKLGVTLTRKLWSRNDRFKISAFDTELVSETSQTLRNILHKRIPEFVETAERFSDRVRFIPVSAMGAAPELLDDGSNAVRPKNITPVWTDVPLVYAMSKWCGGLIPFAKSKSPRHS